MLLSRKAGSSLKFTSTGDKVLYTLAANAASWAGLDICHNPVPWHLAAFASGSISVA
jgi:hypothetical protein